jgi:hypothetical protein
MCRHPSTNPGHLSHETRDDAVEDRAEIAESEFARSGLPSWLASMDDSSSVPIAIAADPPSASNDSSQKAVIALFPRTLGSDYGSSQQARRQA